MQVSNDPSVPDNDASIRGRQDLLSDEFTCAINTIILVGSPNLPNMPTQSRQIVDAVSEISPTLSHPTARPKSGMGSNKCAEALPKATRLNFSVIDVNDPQKSKKSASNDNDNVKPSTTITDMLLDKYGDETAQARSSNTTGQYQSCPGVE